MKDFSELVIVTGEHALSRYFSIPAGALVGYDIETMPKQGWESYKLAGLDPHTTDIRLVQFYTPNVECLVIDLLDFPDFQLRTDLRYAAHFSIFELMHSRMRWGDQNLQMEDTLLMEQLIFPIQMVPHTPDEDDEVPEEEQGVAKYKQDGYTLANAVYRHFKVHMDKSYQNSRWSDRQLSLQQIQYAALDAYAAYHLAVRQIQIIKKEGMFEIYKLQRQMLHVVADMQITGICVDWDAHAKLLSEWKAELEQLNLQCKELFKPIEYKGKKMPVNVNSSIQLGIWLNTYRPELLASWPRTAPSKLYPQGNLQFGSKILPDYAAEHPEFAVLLRQKKLQKMVSSFGESLVEHKNPVTGRIHPTYRLGSTSTGRMSCNNPNLQQAVRDNSFRELFTVPNGMQMVGGDFAQIEVQVQGQLSSDNEMLTNYKHGNDIYISLAEKIFKTKNISKQQRSIAKTCFSGDTEILTERGWVRLDSYAGQKIAQYSLPQNITVKKFVREHVSSSRFTKTFKYTPFNAVAGKIEFVFPLGYVKQKNKSVIHLKDRQVSIKATADHQMYWMNPNNKVLIKGTYADMLKPKAISVIAAGYKENFEEKESDIFTRLLAMVVADGSFQGNTKLRFGFVKRTKLRRCIELFKLYGIKVSQKVYYNKMYSTGKCWRINVHCPELITKLLKYTTQDKLLSWDCLYKLDNRVYLDEAKHWDASITEREDFNRVLFFCTKEQTVDVMQAMAVTSGVEAVKSFSNKKIKSNWNKVFTLSYPLKDCDVHNVLTRSQSVNIEDVYCVEVPSGMILIRHEGKVCVQGNCVLALAYGMGAKKFQLYCKQAGVLITEDEAHTYHKAYHNTFSTYSQWCSAVRTKAEISGEAVTQLGKRRKLASDKIYTQAPNLIVQGTASELLQLCMVKLRSALRPYRATIIAAIHDEILLEVYPQDAESVKTIFEMCAREAFEELFPHHSKDILEAKIGNNWANVK